MTGVVIFLRVLCFIWSQSRDELPSCLSGLIFGLSGSIWVSCRGLNSNPSFQPNWAHLLDPAWVLESKSTAISVWDHHPRTLQYKVQSLLSQLSGKSENFLFCLLSLSMFYLFIFISKNHDKIHSIKFTTLANSRCAAIPPSIHRTPFILQN